MSNVSKEKIKWIAITGSVAAGKSTIGRYLKQLGYVVYDTDQINATLLERNALGYEQLVKLNPSICDESGDIDKAKLASYLFSDKLVKNQIEAILHPLILDVLYNLKKQNKTISFIEVPLLYEANWQTYFDEVWCIVCSVETAISRCMKERGWSEEESRARIANQFSVEKKKALADFVIDGEMDFEIVKKLIQERLEVL